MTPFGITVEVHIKYDSKEYAIGMRSDDFRDEAMAERALTALLATGHYSAQQLLQGKPIDKIQLPFYLS